MESPRIYRCNEWGAKPVGQVFPLHRVEGIVVHHTTSANRLPLLGLLERKAAFRLARLIQADHIARKWADSGQHFLISRGGLILEGRHGSAASALKGLVPRGAHAGDADTNQLWFGIEMEGRFDVTYAVTKKQWAALVDLCAWLCTWGNVDSQQIQPHSHFRATVCPGKLRERIPDLRRAVHDRKLAIRSSLILG